MSVAEIAGIVLEITTEHPVGLRPQRPFDIVTIRQNGSCWEIKTDVGAVSEGDSVRIIISRDSEGGEA